MDTRVIRDYFFINVMDMTQETHDLNEIHGHIFSQHYD